MLPYYFNLTTFKKLTKLTKLTILTNRKMEQKNDSGVPKTQLEDPIQAEIYKFYNNTYCLAHHENRNLIFAVPNGGLRNQVEAMKLKATGTLPGVSDLILYHHKKIEELGIMTVLNIFVEVKTKTGTQRKEQKQFEARVTKMGFKYVIVRSLDEFKEIINKL